VISFILGIAIVYETDQESIPIGTPPDHATASPLQRGEGEIVEETNLTNGFQNSTAFDNEKSTDTTAGTAAGSPMNHNQILDLFKDLASISNRVILWVVFLAPWCIAFLIAGSISEAGQIDVVVRGVGVYVGATVTGILIHIGVSLPVVFFFFTGENPYLWMYSCRKALMIAFSTSSSV
jgi:hypothetical protein